MGATEFQIVLASASPRRSELLELAGVPFRVAPADIPKSRCPEKKRLSTPCVWQKKRHALLQNGSRQDSFLSALIRLWYLMAGSWASQWMKATQSRC